MTVQQNVVGGLRGKGYQNPSLTWDPTDTYTFLTTENSHVNKQSAIIYLFKMNADHDLAQNVRRATPNELRSLIHPSSFAEYDVYCVRLGSNVLIRGLVFANDRVGKHMEFEWIAGAVFGADGKFKLSRVFYRKH